MKDREAWRAAVHGVSKCQAQPSDRTPPATAGDGSPALGLSGSCGPCCRHASTDSTRLPGGWGLGEGREAFLRKEVSTPLSLSVRSLLPHQVKIGGFLLELSLSMPDSHFQVWAARHPGQGIFIAVLQILVFSNPPATIDFSESLNC